MTLGGLVAALVLVIGVVAEDVEGVRLAHRAAQPARVTGEPASDLPGTGQPAPGRPAALDAVAAALGRTQRNAIVTLLVGLLVLMPLLALDPVATALTKPLVLAYLVAAGVAVVVGLVVTPALLVWVVGNRGPAARRPVRALRWLTDGAARVSSRFATSRALAWSGTALLLLGAVAAVPQLDHPTLVPQARELNLLLHLETAPGTSLTEMNRVVGLVAADLRAIPGVAGVGGHIGRAVTSDQFGDVNAGELWITVSEGSDYRATRTAIDQVAAGYPGLRSGLSTYTDDQVAAARTGPDNDLVVRLFGQDLAALGKAGQSVADSISSVAGVRSPHVAAVPKQPTVRVEVDLAAAERHGLRPGDIRREATTLASGLTVGNLYEQAKVFDVVVLGSPVTRANLSGLADLRIDTPSGAQVRLGDVAKVSVAPEQAVIVHEQVMRSLDVVADIQGRDAASVVADVRRAAAGVPMPAEAHLQVLSSALDRQTDGRRLAVVALAVLLGILLVLQALTDGWRRALALLVLTPLGGVGAVLVAPAVGGLGTAGPMLAVFATALLTLLGGLAWSTGAGATGQRVVPVLRTSGLVVALLVPVVLLGERAGAELLRPFALTAIGGVITSAFVVLCLVPALCGVPKGADR
jgi:Cu/Ag efflux pump CusA